MYIQSNTEALSSNLCYSRKAVSITQAEVVFVALGKRDRSGVFQHCCREGVLYSYPK